MISPALLFFFTTGAGAGITGAGGAGLGTAGATFGIAVALELIPADSATVGAESTGGAGSGFRFSTTVGALVDAAG
jgi:hypothetical protein